MTDLVGRALSTTDLWTAAKDSKDSIQSLKEIMNGQFKFFEENPDSLSVLFGEELFIDNPGPKALISRARLEREEVIKALIERGKRQGSISVLVDGEVFATIYIGAIRFAALKWKESNFSYDLSERAAPIFEHLLPSLKA